MSYKHSDTHGEQSLPKEFATVVTDERFISKWELSPITDGDGDFKAAQERYVYDIDDRSINENRRGGLPYSKARCIALVATATGASFTGTFSVQATVIILPLIGKDLNIPDSRLQWIVSAYSLAFGCFLLFWGRIADIYGKKNIFIYGTAWVGLMTVVNPFVENEIIFNLLRGLQGLGAAANVPTALGILGTTFRPGKAKTYAFSAYGAGAPLGSIFGNIIAGVIASYASWKWVFGAMAGQCFVVALAAVFTLPADTIIVHKQGLPARPTVDWIGAILITVGLFALLFALTEGNVVGWSVSWMPTVLLASTILIFGFLYYQYRLERNASRQPLMKISVFRSGHFSAAMLIMGLFFSSFNGFLVYATYFYQSYQGLDALQTTLRFLPTGIVGIITSVLVTFALRFVPTWMILLFSCVCVAGSNLLFALPLRPDASYWAYGVEAMSLAVMGSDTMWPSLTLFTSHALPQEDQALGGALVNAVGQVGRSIGLAIATAIQIGVMASGRGVDVQDAGPIKLWDVTSLNGLRAASWFNFGVGALAAVVAGLAFRGTGIIGKDEPTREEGPGNTTRELGNVDGKTSTKR